MDRIFRVHCKTNSQYPIMWYATYITQPIYISTETIKKIRLSNSLKGINSKSQKKKEEKGTKINCMLSRLLPRKSWQSVSTKKILEREQQNDANKQSTGGKAVRALLALPARRDAHTFGALLYAMIRSGRTPSWHVQIEYNGHGVPSFT